MAPDPLSQALFNVILNTQEERNPSVINMPVKNIMETPSQSALLNDFGVLGRCPECDRIILEDGYNSREKVAQCTCGAVTPHSGLTWSDRTLEQILEVRPEGCELNSKEEVWVASAAQCSRSDSFRQWSICLFVVLVDLFILTGVLVAIAQFPASILGWLHRWDLNLAANPLEQLVWKGLLGFATFLGLLPHLLIPVGLNVFALYFQFGRTQVIVDSNGGRVLTGVWRWQWKRSFDPRQVSRVGFEIRPPDTDFVSGIDEPSIDPSNTVIAIQANRVVRLGFLLSREKRQWMRAVLKQKLLPTSLSD
jgi:hypothetical protein